MKSKVDEQRSEDYIATHARAERDALISEAQQEQELPQPDDSALTEKVKTAFSLSDLQEIEKEISASGNSTKRANEVYAKEQEKKLNTRFAELAKKYKKTTDWLMKL